MSDKEPLKENKNSTVTAAKSRIAFGAKLFLSIGIGKKIMLTASIIAVLHITEPMPLPIAIPTLSCEAAI